MIGEDPYYDDLDDASAAFDRRWAREESHPHWFDWQFDDHYNESFRGWLDEVPAPPPLPPTDWCCRFEYEFGREAASRWGIHPRTGATVDRMSAIMKDVFSNERLTKQFYDDSPFLKRLEGHRVDVLTPKEARERLFPPGKWRKLRDFFRRA